MVSGAPVPGLLPNLVGGGAGDENSDAPGGLTGLLGVRRGLLPGLVGGGTADEDAPGGLTGLLGGLFVSSFHPSLPSLVIVAHALIGTYRSLKP